MNQIQRTSLCCVLALTLTLSAVPAWPIGGQFGLEFAIDAPWRLEPIPTQGGGYSYGAIPIVIAFHDAIFDDTQGWIQRIFVTDQIHVGTIKEVRVIERGSLASDSPQTVILLSQLREIERKRWISTVKNEPTHELCRPYRGEDCRALHWINDSHEWHAMFWFTPQQPITAGTNIQLEVTVVTEYGGDKREFTNYLVVHAGEAPMPRFSKDWLYGDLHYHSQMTDNEGESAYSYRNVVRTLGAMGMDFVFATDHASGGEQVDGKVSVTRCKNLSGKKCITYSGMRNPPVSCERLDIPCKTFGGTEARDLNAVRFIEAKRILYGRDGANEAVARDVETGGIANVRSRGILPQVFMGEEVDAWPEMSVDEQQQGFIRFGNDLQYKWPNSDNCVAKEGLETCRRTYSVPSDWPDYSKDVYNCTVKRNQNACRNIKSRVDAGYKPPSFLVLDNQGVPVEETVESYVGVVNAKLLNVFAPDGTKPYSSRQHLIYMPADASVEGHGWIGSKTGAFGGATRRLEEVIHDIDVNGVAFLAHPLIARGPGGLGPDVVPYSRLALDQAWKSRAILGLQFWNENDRWKAGPPQGEPTHMSDNNNRYRYLLPWSDLNRVNELGQEPWKWKNGSRESAKGIRHDVDLSMDLYHGAYTWDTYLRKGVDPTQLGSIPWLSPGEPRKWFMAGGSDAHGDLNYRRHGQPCDSQWCDTPVGDTALGKPRNLVLAGAPMGTGTPSLPQAKRHTNRQVIEALRGGRFSVTDGPAVRIAIDKNRNGQIDETDFQMGATFNFYSEEHIPLLVEWFSTPEFGPVAQIDIYVGNKSGTFAPDDHGPDPINDPGRQGNFGYKVDPSGALRVNLVDESLKTEDGTIAGKLVANLSPDTPFHGLAKIFLHPKSFGLTEYDKALFYVRAFAKTTTGIMGQERWHFLCPKVGTAGNSCSDQRWAYSNPIWGRYRGTCPKNTTLTANIPGGKPGKTTGTQVIHVIVTDAESLDADNNRRPDICEREIPDPCPLHITNVDLPPGGKPELAEAKSIFSERSCQSVIPIVSSWKHRSDLPPLDRNSDFKPIKPGGGKPVSTSSKSPSTRETNPSDR